MTHILPVPDPESLGRFLPPSPENPNATPIDHWQEATGPSEAPGLPALQEAARLLRTTDTPVGFPTETVYGLAADATRSAAVRGIFAAKKRPADNPLIIHVCDLAMLADYIDGPLPAIYRPLVARFWPGPLTILLPVPAKNQLAPEVTAGLSTFAARMPDSVLSRTLIRLVAKPLAGPSANASTRPSPTTAQHVVDDLQGRIDAVLDGGPCGVGVESTVVDGLCSPPVVLRPGGVSLAQLRSVPGWENVQKAYEDAAKLEGAEAPRAPGMKYKHYSPKAKVILYEGAGRSRRLEEEIKTQQGTKSVAIIRTKTWSRSDAEPQNKIIYNLQQYKLAEQDVLDLDIGRNVPSIAHGLFSALRDLDSRGAEVILVEGLEDQDDISSAVMNRLRKAASDVVKE